MAFTHSCLYSPSAQGDRLAVVMVGLPASGKSFTSRNLSRYLRWLGVETFTFSAALYRQQMIGTQINADFFDASNQGFLKQRTIIADSTLADMVKWFNADGKMDKVAIMDASNTIYDRRRIIRETLKEHGISTIFVECIFEDEGLITENLQFLHLLSPDYENMTSEQAKADYKRRIQFYQVNYEPVDERDNCYIKIYNGGQRLIINNVFGFIPSKILFYLLNMHCGVKRILLRSLPCSAQEAIDSVSQLEPDRSFQVWISPEAVDSEVSAPSVQQKSLLTALNMADLEGKSEEELSALYPEEVKKFKQRSFYYRLPRCESYADLSRRMEPIIMELERLASDVLIVADISVIHCIYSYYVETSNLNVKLYFIFLILFFLGNTYFKFFTSRNN